MWDGVDRGNGAEKRYFNMVNLKKDRANKAHEMANLDLWKIPEWIFKNRTIKKHILLLFMIYIYWKSSCQIKWLISFYFSHEKLIKNINNFFKDSYF